MPTYIMLSTLTPEGVQTIKNNPARIREVNQRGRAARRDRQGAVGDARPLRLRQRRRGARREDDGARLARARLARHGPLRVAVRDPDRRLHRARACEGPRRRRGRARARARPGAAALAAGARGAVRARQRRIRRDARAARRARRRRRRRSPRAARDAGVDLVVVGPEAPLVAGLADALRRRGRALLRAARGRRAAGGLEGVREGDHGGGRRPDRGAPRRDDASRRAWPRSPATRP